MSYARPLETGHYIWPDENGIHFNGTYVTNEEIDIFMYKLYKYRRKEFHKRLSHGKHVIDENKTLMEE